MRKGLKKMLGNIRGGNGVDTVIKPFRRIAQRGCCDGSFNRRLWCVFLLCWQIGRASRRVRVVIGERYRQQSSRRRHTRSKRDCSSDVCSSDLTANVAKVSRRGCEKDSKKCWAIYEVATA